MSNVERSSELRIVRVREFQRNVAHVSLTDNEPSNLRRRCDVQDIDIVNLYWERSELAIEETQKKYERYLTKIAYNILSDKEDSKESVNDTYLAAWNSIPPHRPEILSTYLGKLTRRISIDIFRKRSCSKRKASEYELSLAELCGDGMSELRADSRFEPEESLDVKLLAGVINTFLRELPEDARNLFIGRYYFLDPLKNVARYCGMTESKAKSMLFRTRNKLREYLREEGYEI